MKEQECTVCFFKWGDAIVKWQDGRHYLVKLLGLVGKISKEDGGVTWAIFNFGNFG